MPIQALSSGNEKKNVSVVAATYNYVHTYNYRYQSFGLVTAVYREA